MEISEIFKLIDAGFTKDEIIEFHSSDKPLRAAAVCRKSTVRSHHHFFYG